MLNELGLDIRNYGGKTLRKAVADHDMKTIQYLLDEGVDVNYNEPDMVYPYKATPLTVAARLNNMKMVRYLVDQGADVTIQEKDGERAYTIAVSQKNEVMAEYLKGLEPQDFHEIDFPDDESGIGYIEFFHLINTVEMKMGRQKLLRISSNVDQYSHILIVWNPSKKMIGYADIEHQEHGTIATFEEFLADPVTAIEDFLN